MALLFFYEFQLKMFVLSTKTSDFFQRTNLLPVSELAKPAVGSGTHHKLTYQLPPPPCTHPLSTCFQYTPNPLMEIWQRLALYIAVLQTEQNNKQRISFFCTKLSMGKIIPQETHPKTIGKEGRIRRTDHCLKAHTLYHS